MGALLSAVVRIDLNGVRLNAARVAGVLSGGRAGRKMDIMRRPRFKSDGLGQSVLLVTGDEAAHALRVLRLGVGDEVVVFDGEGREVDGRIRTVSAGAFEVEPVGPVRERLAPRTKLTLAVATPKGARADWLVEKCAELGVEALWLLETERGSVAPGTGKLTRWRRKATEAAKQADLARVMCVEPPRTIAAVVESIETSVSILFGEPRASAPTLIDVLNHMTGGDGIALFIGPEGGFTAEERDALKQFGGRPVRLAGSILRIETAAIAAAAVWASLATADD